MTVYPGSIDNSITLPPASGDDAVSVNANIGATITIETELGLEPAGPYATVRTRLDILEARINNPFSPGPNVNNPFYIGGSPISGVSIQTGFGDPTITLPPAIPGSLYLRQDGTTIEGLYAFRPDGYWSEIDTAPWIAGEDLSGTLTAQKVIGLQGHPLPVPPSPIITDGYYYYLGFNGTIYSWNFLSGGGGGGGGGAPTGPAGGDLGGSYPNPYVFNINQSSVPIGGALTQGNVLQVLVGNTGSYPSSTLKYAPINLAGGSNYVINQLPTANQVAQSLTLIGDVTGTGTTTSTTTTVLKINGTSVPPAPSANQVLVATSGVTATWQQIINAQVSNTAAIAVSKLAAGTSAQILLNNGVPTPTWTTITGDVTLTNAGATKVIALQNNPVSSTTPTDGYALVWDGADWSPQFGIANILYVSSSGSNVTGSGTYYAPFATYNHAASLVASIASSTTPYVVIFAPGNYSENIQLVPWVDLSGGDDVGSVYLNGTLSLSSSFAGSSNKYTEISSVTQLGNVTFNFASIGSTSSGVTFFNSQINGGGATTITGEGSADNIVEFVNCIVVLSTFSLTDIDLIQSMSNFIIGTFTFSSASFGSQWLAYSGAIVGSVTISGSTTCTVSNSGVAFKGALTISGTHATYTGGIGEIPSAGLILSGGATSTQYIIGGLLPVANINPGTNGYVVTTVGGVATWANAASTLVTVLRVTDANIPITITTSNVIAGFLGLTATRTGTLPAIPTLGQTVSFKDKDGSLASHTFIISGNGNNIDGASTFTMTVPFGSITMYWDNVSWGIV